MIYGKKGIEVCVGYGEERKRGMQGGFIPIIMLACNIRDLHYQ
jgi:hypothetical protein